MAEQISKERLQKLLQLEAKAEKQKARWRRAAARERILLQKARKAGLTVSDEEIDEYLKQK